MSKQTLSDQQVRSLGLIATEDDDPSEEVDLEESESDEEESDDEESEPEGDASDDTDETLEEDEEEDEEESLESEKGIKFSKEATKRIQAAETQMREFQSKYDSEKAKNENMQDQFKNLFNQFNQFKQQGQAEQEIDLSSLEEALGDSGELVYVEDVLKKVKKNMKPSEDKKLIQQLETRQQEQQFWVNSQDELSSVRKFINDNSLEKDKDLLEIPTDTVGYFFAIKSRMLETEMEEIKESHKKSLASEKKKTKGSKKTPIPPTSGRGGKRSGKKESMSDMERMFQNFGNRIGVDLTARPRPR